MQSVLPWHVPVVPHESHRVGLPRLGEVLIEASTQLAGEVSIQEVLDDAQVLGRSLGLDGRPLAAHLIWAPLMQLWNTPQQQHSHIF